MIFFSERQLRTVVREYIEHYHKEHYHKERNHQGLENKLIEPTIEQGNCAEEVVRDTRLGGLLNHYRRAA